MKAIMRLNLGQKVFKRICFSLIGIAVCLHIVLSLAHGVHNWGSSKLYPINFDFENTSIDETIRKWKETGISELCCDHSVIISDQHARNGKHSIKFDIRKSDPLIKKSNRGELRVQAAKFGITYNYEFSTFVPLDWQDDSVHTTIAQWHGVPERVLLETGRTPPLFLDIKDGKIGIGNFWDSHLMTKFANFREKPEGTREVWISDLEKGVWADWKFQVKWSIKDDGVIKIFKDGEQIAIVLGPNTYNDLQAPFFKFGLYVPQWKVGMGRENINKRTIYFDDVSVSILTPESNILNGD